MEKIIEEKEKIRKKKLKIVNKVWSISENTKDRYGKGFHWVESSMVMDYINEKVTGDKKLDWVTYVFRKYLEKSSIDLGILSLGCGMGNLERHLCSLGNFKRIDAIDIAKGALQQATESAKKLHYPVKYIISDLNTVNLANKSYGIIFANSSLHHVEKLEHLLREVDKALKNNGLFIINEYVGPSQFQYMEKQVKIINEILEILPLKYRKSVTYRKKYKDKYEPASVEYMNNNDPSEAIRSSEIVDLITKKFDIVEKKDYGGTILHMLLQDMVGNFNENDVKDETIVKLLLYIESSLIREKVIKSDFTFMVLKKRKSVWNQFLL